MTCSTWLLAMLLLPAVAGAQGRRVEANVTYGYAQVLRSTPVYQMVRVPTTEQRCEQNNRCRTVNVVYEERRMVGYDVEYQYKGEKYMSRLDSDPGSRLRLRVTVVPDEPGLGFR